MYTNANQMSKEPVFLARGQGFMWIMDIEYLGQTWTSYSTPDHLSNKEKIIEKAILDLKEKGLDIKKEDVKYFDTRWNVPLW